MFFVNIHLQSAVQAAAKRSAVLVQSGSVTWGSARCLRSPLAVGEGSLRCRGCRGEWSARSAGHGAARPGDAPPLWGCRHPGARIHPLGHTRDHQLIRCRIGVEGQARGKITTVLLNRGHTEQPDGHRYRGGYYNCKAGMKPSR
mgnify:CR=1 FL=1